MVNPLRAEHPRPWIISNWIAIFAWLLAVLALIIGEGRGRLQLLLWGLITPIASLFFLWMGYIY